jgi:transposase InsO family protein
VKHSRKRIARLMRMAGLAGASRRRAGVTTTRREKEARPAPDLVDRNFVAARPNQLRVADITFDALDMAIDQRGPGDVIHHSDRGSQGGFKRSSQRGLNWSSASAGVFQSSVFRGRELRVAATAAISSALCMLRSVQRRRLTGNLAFPHNSTHRVHRAHVCAFHRHVDPRIMLHGAPSMMLCSEPVPDAGS